MVRYWYGANIPPRPLDDKELERGRGGEKYGYLRDGKKFWTNEEKENQKRSELNEILGRVKIFLGKR
jgi:hypothetical protein